MSLRPLAAALGTSDRMLIHYFGSKEQMIGQLLEHTRPDLESSIGPPPHDVESLARAVWDSLTNGGDQEPRIRLFLEIQALALTQPDPYARYAIEGTEAWIAPIAAALAVRGFPPDEAEARAAFLVAGIRGLALERFLSESPRRADRAAELLIQTATAAVDRSLEW